MVGLEAGPKSVSALRPIKPWAGSGPMKGWMEGPFASFPFILLFKFHREEVSQSRHLFILILRGL